MLLPVHIIAGGLAMVLGAVALVASKGGTLHRKSGLLFVYAMLTMGFSGSILALRLSLTNMNVLGGFMAAYFVVTALTTVRPTSPWTRWLNWAALLVVSALSAIDIALGFKALASPGRTLNGVPFFMMFFMATITALAAVGDVRMLRLGTLAAPRGSCATCGVCASRCLSQPDRFFPFVSVSQRSFPSPSPQLSCGHSRYC
jgi:hypothetical protein